MNLITMIDHHKCAGKGCNKQGSYYLRVLFLNRVGYFCDTCKTCLLEDNLVEEPEEASK